MRRPRKRTLALVLLAAVVLIAVIMSVLSQEPRIKVIEPGGPTLGFLPTYQGETGYKLIVYRSKPDGSLEQIGQHGRGYWVIPGTKTYYGLSRPGHDGWEVTVYDEGKKVHAVPRQLTMWEGRAIAPRAILVNGNIFATYRTWTMDVPISEPALAALITFNKKGPHRHKVFSGPDECKYLVSGDGSVLAISTSRTKLYSCEDARVLATIDDFTGSAISYDGKTVIGLRGENIAVCREGKQIAQEPLGDRFFSLRLSHDGDYAVVASKSWATLQALGTESLKPVYEVTVGPDYDSFIEWAISSDGKVAALEEKRLPLDPKRPGLKQTRLAVYSKDGSTRFQHEFEPVSTYPTAKLTWSLDGNCLIYLDAEQNRVVRHAFRP